MKSPATKKPLAPTTPDKNKSEKSDKHATTERSGTNRFGGRD